MGSILGWIVVRLLVAELHGAIGRDIRHRAGTVERDERDDVLETVGVHFDQRLAHAGAFQLEHAHRLAAPEHFVGLSVVERNGGEIEAGVAPPRQTAVAVASTVSVFRPRKSNLIRPAGSTHFMLNWVAGMSDFGSR